MTWDEWRKQREKEGSKHSKHLQKIKTHIFIQLSKQHLSMKYCKQATWSCSSKPRLVLLFYFLRSVSGRTFLLVFLPDPCWLKTCQWVLVPAPRFGELWTLFMGESTSDMATLLRAIPPLSEKPQPRQVVSAAAAAAAYMHMHKDKNKKHTATHSASKVKSSEQNT